MQCLSVAVNRLVVFAEVVVHHAEGPPGLVPALAVVDVIDLGAGLPAEGAAVPPVLRSAGGRWLGCSPGTGRPKSVEGLPEVAERLRSPALTVEHPGEVLVDKGLRPGISRGAV